MDEITWLPASALASAAARGRISAADAVEAYLARIDAVDGLVCAFTRVLADEARAAARALDAEARAGRVRGPLHGVPVAVKDLMAVRGAPMTAGSTMLDREPQVEDATVVRRLRAGGAIVLGLTTLNEFALGTTGVNGHGRTARNPWRLDRIAGGSSSGSAAAVAARLAPCAVGTDTGGSIRIPAALCGIVGLLPTFGRVSRRGVMPLARSFDTVGPMARTVEDVALLLEAMAGPDPDDPQTSARPVERYRDALTTDLGNLRVARLTGPFFESDLDPAVASGLDAAARALEASGMRVRAAAIPSAPAGHEAHLTVLLAEAAAFHRARFPGRDAGYNPDVRSLLEQGAAISPAAVDAARAVLTGLNAEMAALLGDCPLMLAPAVPGGAPRIADADPGGPHWVQIRRQVSRFTRLFNATGLPAVTVPVGLTSQGMPVGVQLAAAPFAEGLLLGAARRVESAIGWSLPWLPAGSGSPSGGPCGPEGVGTRV
jgi:aspartyl-tRNA(Asn)/glutamyl-tRNA(Gln) amidotransferase subunit A